MGCDEQSSPVIKARLVGQEFADSTMRGELFAGTPGLPALRYLISKLATVSPGRERMSLAILDIRVLFCMAKRAGKSQLTCLQRILVVIVEPTLVS